MLMSWVYLLILAVSILCSAIGGRGSEFSATILQGAKNGITLALSLAGSICLWTGVGRVMEKAGLTQLLSRILRPLLCRLFPSTKTDPVLAQHLSGNICANFLGLGNAATPMGILAAKELARHSSGVTASNELCRLIVLNTASIQLIPANVAAVRTGLGAAAPFDILPAVWITSFSSASLGILAAWLMGKLWKHD